MSGPAVPLLQFALQLLFKQVSSAEPSHDPGSTQCITHGASLKQRKFASVQEPASLQINTQLSFVDGQKMTLP